MPRDWLRRLQKYGEKRDRWWAWVEWDVALSALAIVATIVLFLLGTETWGTWR